MDAQIVHYCSERCKLSGKSISGKEFLCSSVSQCYHDPYELIWARPVRLQTASCAYGQSMAGTSPQTPLSVSHPMHCFLRGQE